MKKEWEGRYIEEVDRERREEEGTQREIHKEKREEENVVEKWN